METFTLRKAERKQVKLRVGITAPSGGGKTYSALLLAKGLASSWDKIVIIDTEHGSGELYAHLGNYNVIVLDPPFSPERYIQAIKDCEKAGMEVIIIDSSSHEWDGKGGCLEIQDKLGGRFQDWAKVTPRHRSFLEALLQSSSHIVTTTRRKQDYDMGKDGSGKVRVEKVGMKEVQREGYEYELTLNLELDIRHNAKASKDRTGLFMDKPEFVVTEETGQTLKKWCLEGKQDIDGQRRMIQLQVERLGLAPMLKTKKDTEVLLFKLVGFKVEEDKFEEIINLLKKYTPEVAQKTIEKGGIPERKVAEKDNGKK